MQEVEPHRILFAVTYRVGDNPVRAKARKMKAVTVGLFLLS
jgi:hypothetical protein